MPEVSVNYLGYKLFYFDLDEDTCIDSRIYISRNPYLSYSPFSFKAKI